MLSIKRLTSNKTEMIINRFVLSKETGYGCLETRSDAKNEENGTEERFVLYLTPWKISTEL
jgi:hypothetical protein